MSHGKVRLQFDQTWHYNSPREMPAAAVDEFNNIVHNIATQAESAWNILELFKKSYGSSVQSSSESWATSDLYTIMHATSENAPKFINAFWNGCEEVRIKNSEIALPDSAFINRILYDNNVDFELRLPNLIRRNSQPPIEIKPAQIPIDQQMRKKITESLDLAQKFIVEQHSRQAVQEILWLLETVATGFNGYESDGGTIEGKYFNKIITNLKARNKGTTLEQILNWMTKMHGFLSSPSGGGVRHGTELSADVSLSVNEAELICNLTKSYINYLLTLLTEQDIDELNATQNDKIFLSDLY